MKVFSTFVVFLIMAVSHPASAGEFVRYEDFGAKGDGQTDDQQAIVRAHAYANENNLPVRANDEATYYIGGKATPAIIQTDTDFGQAKFLIDDREVEDRQSQVFIVKSRLEPFDIEDVNSLKKNQPRLDLTLEQDCLVIAKDDQTMRFKRRGPNRNDGRPQTDLFIVRNDGTVDPQTPIIWDFDQISELTAYPIDPDTLTITGGHFTTIVNQGKPFYDYYSRGIEIKRSNVIVENLKHVDVNDTKKGVPYQGFINIRECADVVVRDSVLTGRQRYTGIGRDGKKKHMGTYGLLITAAVNVAMINVTQSNSIHNGKYWGIMGSNWCKNLSFEGCKLSRFDAHMGVHNATIRNSEIGYMGIRLIGGGTFLLEDSIVHAYSLIILRQDYGSTWQGDIILRNVEFKPRHRHFKRLCLITGANDGQHDFGYTCYLPKRVVIDGLNIQDANHHPDDYQGPTIYDLFNRGYGKPDRNEPYPQVLPEEVVIEDVTTASGRELRVSDHAVMFNDVEVSIREPGHESSQ